MIMRKVVEGEDPRTSRITGQACLGYGYTTRYEQMNLLTGRGKGGLVLYMWFLCKIITKFSIGG